MHNKTRVVIYKGTIYKYKTHHPQYIEIITQFNDKNSYLIIYQSKSKWKYKFNSNTTNWIIQKFLLHQFNENKQTNQIGIDSTGSSTTTRSTNIPSNTTTNTTHTNTRTTNTNTTSTANTNTNTTTNTITNTNTINTNTNITTTTTANTNTNPTTNSNSNTTNTNTSTTNTISLNLINDYLNDNDSRKEKTNSIIESLNDLFYATILYRNNKSNYHLSFKLTKTKFKWLHNYSQKSMNSIHYSLSSSLSTGSSCHSINNYSSSFKKSYKSKSCKLIHSNSQPIDSTVSMISNLCISNELNTSQQMCTKNQPKYTTTTTTTTTTTNNNNNNNNNNFVNDTSNILLGLFLESGKHFIFEFNTIHERNLCLASLNKIITMNKQMNAYPDIEFAWSVNVHFKPKDYTSACLIPNNNGSHYLCLTCTEILLIQGNLRIPKLIILYRFVRQCVSRRDGQFRIYTGRASPIGECEIIFQLADHTEAVYVHEQFTRLMHQASVNTPSSSLSSSSSSSNSGWNRFGYSQNNLPPLPRPISLSQNNPLLSEVNLQPIKRLTRSKSISIIYNNNDNNSMDNNKNNLIDDDDDDDDKKKNHSMNNNNKKNNLDYNECNILNYKKNVLHQSCPLLLLLNTIKDNYLLDHHDQQYSKEIKSIQNDHNDTIIINNEIKEFNDNPTSHYLEMNLCDNNIKEDNKNSVILRNQSILHNRIKAFSTCSPLDLIFTSSQLFNEIVSFKKVLCPTIQQQPQQQQSSSSSISNSNVVSHRDNNDLFAQLFFEKPHNPYSLSSSSSYVIGKQNQLSSLTSLHYSYQSQSTSTRSHNSLFHNSNNNNSNGINTTCNSMSSSLSPMMITTSSGSSIFFNCGNSIHGGNSNSNSNSSSTSSTNVRPRTSSDVSNMRRSYFYHSRVHYPHHLQQQHQQQSTMTHTHYLHHSQQRQEYSPRPLSTIDYQTSQNIISNLKLSRDLSSINELLPVNNSNIINPISRPRAATTGSNLLLNKQRLSIVLNHLKMNWFKKQSNMKKITHHNLTTTNYATKYNISSINDNTKKMNEDQHDDGNDDEYVETFPMNMNILSNNLNSLTLQTNVLPNLSNHYMIL
ncbi:unnamed protein product [Schistosoma bovis]|nr:unnamed protein product [Schistosoma bovis]